MELRHLEHFVAVAEEGHFTRAAQRLIISQSGLSASIRTLERELGAALFHRNTRQVSLTEAGRALLAESRRALASVEAAREAVAAVNGLLRGTVRIGAEQCLGAVDVPGLLARFRAAHAGVEVRLDQAGSARLLADVRAGVLDVAFVPVVAPPPDDVDLVPLNTEAMVMLCRPDHRLAGRGSIALSQLHGTAFVDFQEEWGARQLTDAAFAAAGLDRQVTMEVNDVHTLLDLVGHGLGVALVPEHVSRKRAAQGLDVVMIDDTLPRWAVSVALPAAQRRGVAVDRLLELLSGHS
ncbi:LysR family transcriptional regulator [Jiangella alkaliphila]|uniref:DNA-binding transcriptional regulator, LysR family n=1 Tax=Jiangella alkaliphila TaxID=419479 RepID=A0A1H2FX15_9ACTN|nr:LysR family transcriptional regulator [Jiangella alkaliphila]SDU11886.1 DNA-binding transcriptional regulator, LysR family [Jiangella alkaliphila]